ncbi:MAG: serine/threonine-protein kinase [Verrucomicrobia bacterium]|nr:serine/threonine-protein kinase [Verrucomicrobiota bacterium]
MSESASSLPVDINGEQVGPYRLVRLLGEGGFARVWLAHQEEPLTREVALKMLKPGMASDEILRRFKQELEALTQMNHPNVARVLDAGESTKGQPYLAMELVPDALFITDWCRQKDLDLSSRLRLFLQLCGAVQHAHQQGIIHRDLKPSNVLVSAGQVKVIDFGIARAIAEAHENDATLVLGSKGYMSPEQCAGSGDVDTRSDVFAMGALLAEMLGPSPPRDLHWIIRRCLEAERARRYASANALAEDVQRFLDSRPVTARAPSVAYITSRFLKRHALLATACMVAAGALVAGFIVSQADARSARQRAERAEKASGMIINVWKHAGSQKRISSDDSGLLPVMKNAASPSFPIGPNERCKLLNMVSQVSAIQMNLDLSLEAAEKALTLIQEKPTEIQPEERIACYTSLAVLKRNADQPIESVKYFRQALEEAQAWQGDLGEASLTCCRQLGSALMKEDQREAESLLREALSQGRKLKLPNTHSQLLRARADLNVLLMERGQLDEARLLLDEVIQHVREAGPPERGLALRLLLRRGLLMVKLRDDESAFEAYTQAMVEAMQ